MFYVHSCVRRSICSRFISILESFCEDDLATPIPPPMKRAKESGFFTHSPISLQCSVSPRAQRVTKPILRKFRLKNVSKYPDISSMFLFWHQHRGLVELYFKHADDPRKNSFVLQRTALDKLNPRKTIWFGKEPRKLWKLRSRLCSS